MMNTAMITAGQAARAMGLDEKEMAVLLNESGVCTANGLLTPADTETLLSYLAGQQEDSRRRAQENLERLSARYAFLIDTCSLLDEHFPALVEHLMPLLEANGKKLFVPSGVPAELRSLLAKKPELRGRIATAAQILAGLKEKGLAAICGGTDETFADKQMLEVATKFLTSTELLSDAESNFVGYRMECAHGTEPQRALFTRPALEAHFPEWKKADTVQLCITILEKICALHEHGIILGDINPLNILVVSATEVWFVDCDSYQIGGYPCPVGTVRFTAPEIQKRNFADFLRTEGNEAFAIATLLFMIMLPGKSPYAQEGGGDLGEAILAMDFPYPCGDNHSDKTPEGAWRFLWSHLPRYIKDLIGCLSLCRGIWNLNLFIRYAVNKFAGIDLTYDK